MRIAFMGTPAFAASSLRAIIESAGHEVVAVVSQPDRRAGRGKKMVRPPVAALAAEHGIPLLQPESAKTKAFRTWLGSHNPDLAVVVAFGHILGPKALAVPIKGCINVHASVLPRWRGASPIQASVLAGDAESGVTIIQMDPGMDTGNILAISSVALAADETAVTLHDTLAALGAKTLLATLDAIEAEQVVGTAQNHGDATMVAKRTKAESAMDWTRPAIELHQQIRGLTPWPGTQCVYEGAALKVHPPVALGPPAPAGVLPGTVVDAGPTGVVVACGDGQTLVLKRLQRAGKRAQDIELFLAGAPIAPGSRLQ